MPQTHEHLLPVEVQAAFGVGADQACDIASDAAAILTTMEGLFMNHQQPKDMKVAELSRRDTQLVLVLAAQHTYEEAIFRKRSAKTVVRLSLSAWPALLGYRGLHT